MSWKLLMKGLGQILQSLSMTTHKKASNCRDFALTIPENQRAKEINIRDLPSDGTLPVVKTLGLIYVPADDVFILSLRPGNSTSLDHENFGKLRGSLVRPTGIFVPLSHDG